MKAQPRIAIVSDPLVQRGGAEKFVADVLGDIFPDAPIHAVLYSERTGPKNIADRVVPSVLQNIPGATRRHRWLLPLYPIAVESMDLRAYDVIISSHHTAAKGILRRADQRHICYCHTPMRALWERPHEELAEVPWPLRPLAAQQFCRLRQWDYATASRVDLFLANSATTAERIKRHYGRESRLVYSPVNARHFTPPENHSARQGDYYLVASRQVPYKRVDLAIEATGRLGRKLIVTGDGPSRAKVAERHVEYLGHVSDAKLLDLMQGARALIFPGLEDFGMAPVEVMACGRPVIAFAGGGAMETIIDGVTGTFAFEQTVDAFVAAILRFETLSFDPARIVQHARTFSYVRFAQQIRQAISDVLQK